MIKVLIADDQALIRESLQIILSAHADIEVVGTVGDGKEVLEKLHRVRPDVILMDIRMPVMDGVLCTKAVKEQYPDVKIIILTTFDDDEFIFSALKYGASGYILKGVSTEELHEAIQTVYRGGAMINPNIATKVFKIFSQMAQSNFAITVTEENIEDMSRTEWKIIQQIGFGISNKEIAAKLFLSEGTVRNYLSGILAKLNLRDRTQLAIWAVQTGVTQRDFSKENDKWSGDWDIWPLLVVLIISVALAFVFWASAQEKVLRIGVYAGSSWDVPNSRENKVLDSLIKKFEKTHPHVKVVYESGIPKDDYADWLAEQVLKGEQPDLFMVPENDFSMLASTGALKSLDTLLTDDERKAFYPVAYEAGQYQGVSYALPVESNPIMMCVNKDLLEKERISIPESGWTLADFYEICKKVTKDTNGDGMVDQYGITDYTWQQALVAYGGHLTNKYGINVDSSEMHQALSFMSKLDMLSRHYKVTSNDFDEGRVAFYPMSLAQYRTYKPYPYHVAKYFSAFLGLVSPMPNSQQPGDGNTG